MSDFLALQQFIPQERTGDGSCIWCMERRPKNRAHVLSRKLTNAPDNNAVLRFNVCEDCNTQCGKVEEWILRHTPLGWMRFFHYLGANRGSTSRYIPAYLYSHALDEWVVYELDSAQQSYRLASQLLVCDDGCIKLLSQSSPEDHETEMNAITDGIRTGRCAMDERLSLPEDFSPRVLLDGINTVIVTRTRASATRTRDLLRNGDTSEVDRGRVQLDPSGAVRQHFTWSAENWARFSAKIAYETLCLFAGPGFCLAPHFATVRRFVLQGVAKRGRELVFNERGPMKKSDVPRQLHLDLTVGQAAPQPIPALKLSTEPGSHAVAVYEVDGWIASTVAIGGFPSSVLVLGGPDAHLDDLYLLKYYENDEALNFARLAYDKDRPVIPIQIAGRHFKHLARTYRLKPI